MSVKPIRCQWCGNDPLYIKYHDEEWGKPTHDDKILFEFIILESFQAGLSWLTILRKRAHFREAFDGFDYNKIALYDIDKQRELVQNSGIIRNKLKIKSAITNAQAFIAIQKEFGSFNTYIWAFVNHQPIVNQFMSLEEIPASTPLSDKISKDLKQRGFKFIGTTIIYAYMQACGLVDDHIVSCFCHSQK